MFGFLKGKTEAAAKRLSGKTDVLEAAAAAIAIVASADGSVDDDEIATAIDVTKQSEALAGAFSQSQIEEAIEKQLNRAKTRVGRAALLRELDDIAKMDAEIRSDVWLIAADVADKGGIDEKEKAVLKDLAGRLSVNPSSLGVTL